MSSSSGSKSTNKMWADQDRHTGDRLRLFRAVASALEDPQEAQVLYPGCFVDIAPSMVFPSVTYVDVDKRTPTFFADEAGIKEIIASETDTPPEPSIGFIHADYTTDLGLELQQYDLLVSLYAGFISEHCTDYLKVGGTLLVNPSHGDAAMASIDRRFRLSGVIISRSGDYTVRTKELDDYLVPKKPVEVTAELLHQSGRGIGYTKSPFAYLFTRIV